MVQTDLNSLILTNANKAIKTLQNSQKFKMMRHFFWFPTTVFLGGAFRVTRNGQFVCKSQQHIHKSTVAYKLKKSFVRRPVDFHPITCFSLLEGGSWRVLEDEWEMPSLMEWKSSRPFNILVPPVVVKAAEICSLQSQKRELKRLISFGGGAADWRIFLCFLLSSQWWSSHSIQRDREKKRAFFLLVAKRGRQMRVQIEREVSMVLHG